MNKRPHNNNHNLNIFQRSQNMLLNRQKAEEMCQTKLRKISKVKSKLVQTVLIRNTLKYVQNCEHVTFAYDDDDDIKDIEYEPFNKKPCKDISTDDIDEILSELNYSHEFSEKERLKFKWNDAFSVGFEYDTLDDRDNSVVPDNEVLEYLSDADYLNYL